MSYIKKFESFKKDRNLKSVNEELLSGVLNFFKNMWNKAVEEIKKLGENPAPEEIEAWIDKNPLNPQDDSYLLKGVMDEFIKKKDTDINEQACLDLIKNILDPQLGALGKQGLQTLYDGLLKSFGKDTPTVDIVKFYMETIRNRAIKDYKYAGGPDLKVGTDAKVDDKKIVVDMKDQTHLPEFKKAILPAGKDTKKMKQLSIDWVNKILVPRLDKYLSEIKDEDVDKYVESLGKEVPEAGPEGGYKAGDTVIYKRDKFNEDEWKKITDEDKKKPNEGPMKDLQDKEMIGIKKVKDINGDVVSFEDADFKKKTEDLLGKVEAKAEGQEDLVNTLKDVKTKNPEAIKKISDIADLYKDPDVNKDKIAEIEKQLGGGEEQ